MAKKTTKPQSNTNLPVLTKSVSFMDFLKEESLLANPGKFEWRERLINTMMLWAEDPDSLEVMQFCIAYRINYKNIARWAAAYEDVGEAYDNMKRMLASHRRIGAAHKKLDANVVFRDIWKLDTDELVTEKHLDDRTKQNAAEPTVFNVNFDKPAVITRAQGKKNETQETV
jgi:hypothetical protein